jgi:predicted transcriptional regulator of viral defense system
MKRTLSGLESKLVMELEWEKRNLITPADVRRHLRCDNTTAWKLLHKLERKRWFERIQRGLYLFIPAERGEIAVPPLNPFLVASRLVEPYYLSYATAAAHYGFTTQMRPVIFISTTKRKKQLKWRNSTFKFVTLSAKKFFGYTTSRVQDTEVQIAETEKAVVDCLDKPRYAGGIGEIAMILHTALRKADHAKLIDYAIRMGSNALVQRLGFLSDVVRERFGEGLSRQLTSTLRKHVGRSLIYIAPTTRFGYKGAFNKTWHVVENISREQLLAELTIG